MYKYLIIINNLFGVVMMLGITITLQDYHIIIIAEQYIVADLTLFMIFIVVRGLLIVKVEAY